MSENEINENNQAPETSEPVVPPQAAPQAAAPQFSTPAPTKPVPEYYFPPAPQATPVAEAPVAASVPPAGTIPPAFSAPTASAPRERSKATPIIAAAVVAALIGGATGAGAAIYFSGQSGSNSGNTASQAITINDPKNVNAITAVAAKASPSVVTIMVSSDSSAGSGSGVILDKEGYVLTNNHVATLDGASSDGTITVQDNDGNIYTASIVGTDPTVDLAVLKIDSDNEFVPIEWADSAKLNVGDITIAMGAPLGLAGTVTQGIISALNRSIQIASSAAPDATAPDDNAPDSQSPFDFWNFDFGQEGQTQQQTPSAASASISVPVIQTDAAINPGNSGGALLDAAGKLIGINVAIASAGESAAGSIGVGFALPSNLAKRVAEELIANQTATHGLLGAQVSDAGAKEGSTAVGAYIEEVVDGGAATKGGMKAGDIVTEFNGVRITDANDLTAQVRTAAGGSDATVVLKRDGKTQTLKVTLGTL